MQYGFLQQPLRVSSAQYLYLINALLHDETAEMDCLRFDVARRILDIPIRRQFHDGDEILLDDNGISCIYEKSWMRTQATVRHVQSWSRRNDQNIGCYTFNHWQYAKGLITIEFNQMLMLDIQVDSLDVELRDLGFMGRARIERRAGSESSSSDIY